MDNPSNTVPHVAPEINHNQQLIAEAQSEQNSTSVPTTSGNNLDALAVGKWVIKDQSETRVSKDHVNTRFFIISDTHSSDRINEATQGQSADVLILCGDITRHSLIEEYKYVGQVLGGVDAPLKLVIPGNHDGSLDESRFWDEGDTSYNKWPVRKGVQNVDQLAKLFGSPGDAKKALERYGFQVLNEGHNSFNLSNGATLKVYASPYTPSRGKGERGKRGSPYRAFQYGQENGHEFLIDEDVDIVITHGPPLGISDPGPERFQGCELLFNAIARARPRLHCFGHNHGGWGATWIEWSLKSEEDECILEGDNGSASKQPNDATRDTRLSAILNRKELMSVENIATRTQQSQESQALSMTQDLVETRCVPTSHCAGDENFVQKGKQTLFVNAAWAISVKCLTKKDGGKFPWIQWPWLVDIELLKKDGHDMRWAISSNTPESQIDDCGNINSGIKDLSIATVGSRNNAEEVEEPKPGSPQEGVGRPQKMGGFNSIHHFHGKESPTSFMKSPASRQDGGHHHVEEIQHFDKPKSGVGVLNRQAEVGSENSTFDSLEQMSSTHTEVDSGSITKVASVIPRDSQQRLGGTKGSKGGYNRGSYQFDGVERGDMDVWRPGNRRPRSEE